MIQLVRNTFTRMPPSLQGAIWMTLSAVLFASQAGIVRHLSADFHFIEISFFRALFGIVAMVPWLMRRGIGVLRTPDTGLYVARGFLSTAAMYGWFGGITLIALADATAISFTFPLFIALFGVMFLKEPAHATRWIALAVGFLGTLIVVRPGFEEVNIGVFMVIGAGLCIAGSAMILKVTLRSGTPDVAALYQSIYMLPFALIGVLFVWEWPNAEQWLWAFALGAASATAQRLYSRAFAVGDVGAITPFDFMRLPFAIMIGLFIFSEVPDVWTIVGGGSGEIAARFAALPDPVRGTVWMLAAGVSLTLMASIIRHLSQDLHTFEIALFRTGLGLVFMAPWLMRNRLAGLKTGKIPWYVLRAVFTAITTIPIGTMRPKGACVFLGALVGGRRWAAMAVGFAGVLVMVRPGFETLNLGLLAVFIASICGAAAAVLIRYLSRTEAPDTISTYYAIFTTPMMLVPALFVWITPTWEQLGWLMLMGLLGTIGQRTMSRGFAAADASIMLPVDFSRLIFAALFGFFLFAEIPSLYTALGALMIFTATVYIARRESAKSRARAAGEATRE